MAFKKASKFRIIRAINQPSAAYLMENHVVMVGGVPVSNLHHDDFFAIGDEMKRARASNIVLHTGWFEAEWLFPAGDADTNTVRDLGVSVFKVKSKIDNAGNPIGPKVEAPSPPFTPDGIAELIPEVD